MNAKQRILILGATGMLGHRLGNGLISLGYDVLVGVRNAPDERHKSTSMPLFCDQKRVIAGLNAMDIDRIRAQILDIKADVVINCIGVIKQKKWDNYIIPSIAINALLPHVLEEAVTAYGGTLIHFSTDCVFRGNRGCYSESDTPDADDLYGRTKAIGEVIGENALTLRTSIIGPEIYGFTSLVEWFLANAAGRIKGYDRALYSGLTTREMVGVVAHVLSQYPLLRGLYHVASQPISKHDLLLLLRDELGLVTEIVRDTDFILDRSMSSSRFEEATGYVAPSWREMIAGLGADIREYWEAGWNQKPSDAAFVENRLRKEIR